MKETSTFKKYLIILEELQKRGKIDAYDEYLAQSLELSPKQLGRLLEELSDNFDSIVKEKQDKKRVYRLIKPIDLFIEAFKNSHEIGWLFSMAQDADPSVFQELEKYTKKSKDIYLFKNTPFEDIKTLEEKDIFVKLKKAVQNREYRKIKFKHDANIYDNLKCLKLIFMDGNWYLAFVDNTEKLRFGRISFIERVEYASKNSFQPASVEHFYEFLKSAQNSLTLYGIPQQTAIIKALPKIARYFEKDMKKFLSTQEFISKEADGSVLFSLKYTQPLEILPFIKRWLPDIVILEPIELRTILIEELKLSLENQNK